jgi:alpha-L-rhamnosidase
MFFNVRILILMAIGCLTINALADSASLTPVHLRCEHLTNPLGVDVMSPRLDWQLMSPERNQVQSAYRILVADNPQILAGDHGNLWDTGKVMSDNTLNIPYAGKMLQAHQHCYWKVRVWNGEGKASAWSEVATWEIGIANSDWKAQWIGSDELRKNDQALKDAKLSLPLPVLLRTSFTVDKPVTSAILYATALGNFDVHLNGRQINEGYFNPGWTDYSKRVYYRAFDVTGDITKGRNAIGAVLADGWYSGYIGWGHKRDHYGKKPRFRAQLHLQFKDGTSMDILSSSDWKAAVGPTRYADFLMGERYDARDPLAKVPTPRIRPPGELSSVRVHIPTWTEAGFDDGDWRAVDTGAEVEPVISWHPGPQVKAIAEFQAKSITEPKPGVYVLNLGQNFAGFVRLKISGQKGQEITLRYAERLNPDGTIYTTNLRGALATDRYICGGYDTKSWSPHFTFHGFQYVEITGLTSKPTEDQIVGVALSSATPTVGQFSCSDPTLNQLRSNIYWTQRSNFIDIPTDCPQRDERLGWMGDAQVYCRAATLNCDVEAFYTKWLQDVADGQRADGEFPMVAPVKVAGDDGGPAWADAGVIVPWTVYEVYGDKRLLARQYPSMVKFVEFNRNRSTPDLLPPAKFHCFGDWLNIKDETPIQVIYEAYFAKSAWLTAKAAAVLGKDDDAKKYYDLFEQIKTAFNNAYVKDDGTITGDTQTCYVLAIAFNLLDSEQQQLAAQHLVDHIKQRDWHLSTGFIGTKDLMLALSKIGREDVAYRLLHQRTFPGWEFSIGQGATSIWERWDGWTPQKGFQDPGMNSFAHYSFGAVYQWMVENIGGIRNDDARYHRIIIAPKLDPRLRWASTSYDSVRGPIKSDWMIDDSSLKLSVSIPPNTTAVVVLPRRDNAPWTENGKAGNSSTQMNPRQVVLQIGSGDYEFVTTPPVE